MFNISSQSVKYLLLICILLFITVCSNYTEAQTTVLLTADYDAAIGYHDNYNTANNNYNTAPQNAAYVVPGTSGGLNVNRALIHFDLTVIPPGATVLQARMNLYALGVPPSTITHLGTNNSAWLQRINQPWSTNTVTWNNQPTSTNQNQSTLPVSTSPLQNYTNIDVTQLVIDMLSTNNYGFLVRLANEALTNALVFSSINCGTPSKYPTLEITYVMPGNSPPIHCLEVLQNGDVRLTWEIPDTTVTPFHSYHIWHSTNHSGPYTKFDSIYSIHTTDVVHTGANANTQPSYYFLTVQASTPGNPVAPPLDTVSTIFLSVTNTNPTTGSTNLNWNPIRSPLLPSCPGEYLIWREYPAGTWQHIGSTSSTIYHDTNIVCDEIIRYKIEIYDTIHQNGGIPTLCSSISSIDEAHFSDQIPPITPSIYSVTVDTTTNTAIISWNRNPVDDTEGYILYLVVSGSYIPLDTLWNRDDTLYYDYFSNPCLSPVSYAVTAYDSCYNESPKSLVHHTLILTAVQTYCMEEVILSWNEYINMSPAMGGYEIMVSENGGPMNYLSFIAPGVSTYMHNNLTMGNQYCYLLRGESTNQLHFSETCITCITLAMPDSLETPYIRTATIENNNLVKVILHNNPALPAQEYILQRSENGMLFQQIATIPWLAQNTIEYLDLQTNVHNKSYYYRALVVDLCGNITDTSNMARTILLSALPSTQYALNQLLWNDYEGFDGYPTNYLIWRTVNENPDISPLATYPPSILTFADDVIQLGNSTGKFTYQIEAVEGSGNYLGIQENARSNIVEIIIKPKIYIPSAFVPTGNIDNNKTFKPVGLFLSNKGYEFMVFNRFGQMIFHTNDVEEGWDGTYQGQLVPEGVYVYKVAFLLESDELYSSKGSVTLIR